MVEMNTYDRGTNMNKKVLDFFKTKIIESGADLMYDCWHEFDEIYEITGKEETDWKDISKEYNEAIEQLKNK